MSIFTGQHIFYYFDKLHDAIERKIKAYDYRQLKDFEQTDIEAFVNHYRLDNIAIDLEHSQKEAKNDEREVYNYNSQIFDDAPEYVPAKGKTITFYVPVLGEISLLKYSLGEQGYQQLNYHDDNYEDMELINDHSQNGHSLRFEIFIPICEFKNKTKEEVSILVDKKLREYVQTTLLKIKYLNAIIDSYNNNLRETINKIIQEKIDDDSSLDFICDAIGVEVNSKNPLQNKGTKIEILPKKVDILLPDRKKYNGYYLDKNNYFAIISTIRNHLIATETNPKAIKVLNNEELIRDTILWALNSNYIIATGETFRNNGKTDILISFKDKSVFVAECKIWKGAQYLRDGLDQMLSYTTWRDSKMAMIVFNLDNKDYAHVCLEVKKCLESHLSFKRITNVIDQAYFECELIDKNNEGSTITVAVLCANYVDR